mmetsp:Transcript_59715/g.124748  ORF Transcript_59715/g.124748 Transcript_59715/m.124748 type:complete len:103 (+) Transcript_59715:234-542(+)
MNRAESSFLSLAFFDNDIKSSKTSPGLVALQHACSFITGSMVLRKMDAFCVECDSSIDENKSSVPLPIPGINILTSGFNMYGSNLFNFWLNQKISQIGQTTH